MIQTVTAKEDYLPGAVSEPAGGYGPNLDGFEGQPVANGRFADSPRQVVISCSYQFPPRAT